MKDYGLRVIYLCQADNESHVLVSFTCPSHPSYESSEKTASVEELLRLRQDSKGKPACSFMALPLTKKLG